MPTLSPAVDGGANVAVTPTGSPVAVKLTASAKPPVRATPIVPVTKSPWAIVNAAGTAASVKSPAGVAFTTRSIVVVRVRPPPVPVTVTVAGPGRRSRSR